MANTSFVLNGNVGMMSSRQMLAANGSYFVVTNPTIGTGILSAVVTAWSATANGLFMVQNTNAPGGKTIYFDYLSLILTGTAPTATTAMKFDFWNEIGLVTGTTAVATRTPVNLNSATYNTGAVVQGFNAGQITIPAAVGARRALGTAVCSTSLGVTGDNYVVQFGADGTPSGTAGLTAVRATAPTRIVTNTVPVIVPPGSTSWINMYWLTQATNAGTYEFEFAFAEI